MRIFLDDSPDEDQGLTSQNTSKFKLILKGDYYKLLLSYKIRS